MNLSVRDDVAADTAHEASCPIGYGYSVSSNGEHEVTAGTVLEGKYRLEREVGAGGMGQVFLAEHETIERTVAIKVLHQELASDESVRRRFETEAKAIARLKHPNCVMLYEFGYSDEIEALFAVFEYVEGTSLEYLIGKQLPVADVLEVGKQVADGIDHAHDQNVIHRDLKPENIMAVSSKGEPVLKVLDFGIARIAEDDEKSTRLTKMGQMFGTPPYMSPEQVRAKLNITFATDIYAIGVILYELLEGELPFIGDTPIATVMMHLNDEVPPIERDDVPEELVAIVMRCLEKEAGDRFSSCAALQQALDEVEWSRRQPSMLVDDGESDVAPSPSDSDEALKATMGTPEEGIEKSESDETSGAAGESGESDGEQPEDIASAPTMMADEAPDSARGAGDEQVGSGASSSATTTDDIEDYDDGFDEALVGWGERRTRLIVASVALIALVILGGAVAMVVLPSDPVEGDDAPDEHAASADPEPGQERGGGAGDSQEQIAIEPAGVDESTGADEPDDGVGEDDIEDVPGDDVDDTGDVEEADELASDGGDEAGGDDAADDVGDEPEVEPEPAGVQEASSPEPSPTPTPQPQRQESPPEEESDDDDEAQQPDSIEWRRRDRDDEADDDEDAQDVEQPEGIGLPQRD